MSIATITGRFENFNAGAQAAAADALMSIARYVQGSGKVDGTIRMDVKSGDGRAFSVSVLDVDAGPVPSGDLVRADEATFEFVLAFDRVDEAELLHLMAHAVDDMAVEYAIDPVEGLALDAEGHHVHEEHEHHHHHDDDDDDECECGCHHHHHHDDDEDEHEHHHDSMEEAGGVAVGITGTFPMFDRTYEDRLASALMKVGTYVQGESGCLLGHIKASVMDDSGNGITLNLIDMDNGVEHHGELETSKKVRFAFMCAVLDVTAENLRQKMVDAIMNSGLRAEVDPEEHHHHHHHHGEEHGHHHDERAPSPRRGKTTRKPLGGLHPLFPRMEEPE